MSDHVSYPGCYCADCVEGTPSARITGDKDRENPVEGAPHTNLDELEALLAKANDTGHDWWLFSLAAERESPAMIARIRELEAENEAIKAARDGDGELLTIAWMDGSHRSTKAHRERIKELEAERDRLREALRKILAGEYPRPLGKPWRMDMTSSKHDRCIHDEWMYETCEGCLDAFVSAALEASDENR